jgi:hypothetical protein
MQAPTIADLLRDPTVRRALEDAWADSVTDDPARRHEEGGWVYADAASGTMSVRRAPAGGQALLDLGSPPVVPGSVVVATFHTHPNPSAEGWDPGPSAADTRSAWALGVLCLIGGRRRPHDRAGGPPRRPGRRPRLSPVTLARCGNTP